MSEVYKIVKQSLSFTQQFSLYFSIICNGSALYSVEYDAELYMRIYNVYSLITALLTAI